MKVLFFPEFWRPLVLELPRPIVRLAFFQTQFPSTILTNPLTLIAFPDTPFSDLFSFSFYKVAWLIQLFSE